MTLTSKNLWRCYDAGVRARENGDARNVNPFNNTTQAKLRNAWDDGWCETDKALVA